MLRLFQGKFVVHEGGNPSSFRNVSEEKHVSDGTGLYHIRGSNEYNTRAVQVCNLRWGTLRMRSWCTCLYARRWDRGAAKPRVAWRWPLRLMGGAWTRRWTSKRRASTHPTSSSSATRTK